ncbi:MAG: hypothetical protein WEB88_08080 [Gemmatimonadota bacterium]
MARGPPQPDLPLDGEPPLDPDQTPAFEAAEAFRAAPGGFYGGMWTGLVTAGGRPPM